MFKKSWQNGKRHIIIDHHVKFHFHWIIFLIFIFQADMVANTIMKIPSQSLLSSRGEQSPDLNELRLIHWKFCQICWTPSHSTWQWHFIVLFFDPSKGRVKIYQVPGPGPSTEGRRLFSKKIGGADFFRLKKGWGRLFFRQIFPKKLENKNRIVKNFFRHKILTTLYF